MEQTSNTTFTEIISAAVKLPGVKVNREAFLREQFKRKPSELVNEIVNNGPIEAGCTRDELLKLGKARINALSTLSSGASFVAGVPGGFGMAVAIPADVAQFYGIALRLAQELSYLYGIADIWQEGELDHEDVMHQLVLYCGVMLGASGAAQAVRVMSRHLADGVMKQLQRSPITRTMLFRIAKTVLKWFNINLLKKTAIQSVGKAIPIIGGVVSGAITFASMKPMGMRLLSTLDKAGFDYTESELQADLEEIEEICEREEKADQTELVTDTAPVADAIDQIEKIQKLLEAGVITEEEFSTIKARIISEM